MSHSSNLGGPWVPLGDVPSLRQDFRGASDETLKIQMQDMQRTEAQRRDEQGGRSDSIADKATATYELQPPPHIRDPVIKDTFDAGWKQGWMAAQREAAMAQAAHKQPKPEPQRQQEHIQQPTLQPRR